MGLFGHQKRESGFDQEAGVDSGGLSQQDLPVGGLRVEGGGMAETGLGLSLGRKEAEDWEERYRGIRAGTREASSLERSSLEERGQ